MKTMFCILLLSSLAGAGQRPLEPVRVSIAVDSEATADDREFNQLLTDELGRRGNITFTSARFDAKILTSTNEISVEGRRIGFAAATAVLTPHTLRLHIATAGTLDALAEDAAAWLGRELQTNRRGK